MEYINGIEAIKVFGKAQCSYEKFVIAVKEGASCYAISLLPRHVHLSGNHDRSFVLEVCCFVQS